PAPEADDDAVRILTIHGAKGLEFPMVVLAGLGTLQRDVGPLVTWGGRPEVAVGPKQARFTTPGWEAAASGATDAARDEGRRLLYVAATRARDHLVVGLAHPERHKPTDSYAAQLWHAAGDEGPLAPLARRVRLPDQLALEVGPALVAPPVVDDGERGRWIERFDALVATTHRPRILSATAVAQLGQSAAEAAGDDRDLDRDGSDAPSTFRRGGTARGRAVHGVLQTVDLDDPGDLGALSRLHAAAEGIGALAGEVARLSASALEAPTVRAARAAKRRWREVTVSAPLGDGQLIEGYVDLLFEDDAGALVVVDHKTDSARGVADLDEAVGRYRLQLAAYAIAVEAAAARPVGRAVLVFARPDGPAVEREIADLPAAMAEVRSLVSTAAAGD
ncbi:MAG: PD-(D/E)XK nuclease family protein, partial [Acidimicrobiales bacterium]